MECNIFEISENLQSAERPGFLLNDLHITQSNKCVLLFRPAVTLKEKRHSTIETKSKNQVKFCLI